jgi:hypothetical protein
MPMEAQRDTEQKYTYLVRQRNRVIGLAASDPAVRGKSSPHTDFSKQRESISDANSRIDQSEVV